LTFATYPTLTDLVNAVIALGVGWSASVVTGYGDYPSTDLYVPQEVTNVRNSTGGCFGLFSDDLARDDYSSDLDMGILYASPRAPVRIDYRAGFDEIPDPIKQATLAVGLALLAAPQGAIASGSGVSSRSLGDRSIEFAGGVSGGSASLFTPMKRQLLSPYVAYRARIF
jgi:hypothetical protein